ncbi:MAG: metallophosphoesterase family protein [Pyrinomonadaceae bacterium]|nr:DNA repair exonuclease [Pyrinomonadaceae bacterium]MDQ3586300.1 DNA repair exonuclease [Acidobacteriota bacterium]
MKFLHVADIHLGCRRYNLDERMKDFARAWLDVIQTHAIQNKVDFVLIAGDFFNARKVEPEAMNHAIAGLELLREAGIPVVAIEGNHDQRDLISDYSWMRSLSRWGYLKLLEPAHDEEGHLALIPWDEEEGRGSYLDIAGARIFGTHWYGTSANAAIPLLADALRRARGEDRFNILLLHTDVEGQLSRPNIPALSLDMMKKLQSLVDYLALGHTHKRFEIDNWAFNPGSLEACSIDEYREERGLYLVEVDDERRIRAQHLRDYIQRPFQRLSFDVSGSESPDAVYEGVLETVRREARAHVAKDGNDTPAPIIEINLRGHLGFKNSLLDIARIRADAREQTGALHVMITNRSVPVEYAVAAGLDADASRQVRERRIIEDLIARDNRYKAHAHEMAQLVLEAKRLALTDEAPEEILKTIEDHLTKHGLAQALESPAAPNEQELITSTAALGALERNATT